VPDEQLGDPAPDGAVPDEAVPDEAVPDEAAPDKAVPDAPVSDAPAPDAPIPDEPTLASIATPGTVRRAPKYGAFVGTGVVLGAVVGYALAAALDTGALAGEGGGVLPFLGGSAGARAVTALAFAGLGALVGALLALWADARSRRRAR
jgi:hypothetical protein